MKTRSQVKQLYNTLLHSRNNITMHIKQIVIHGFKTYKNVTIVEDLSPGHNVVVGRNGSGKSNFFAAIRFVLSDTYTHMSREERMSLIHEGTAMSASVEIIFDNTDGRFPVNKSEISIARTIGLTRDDYTFNGKTASHTEIMGHLESAGFSKANPYYIVPQGRITALTNSKDQERLALLKEVSGATVFETRLKDSIKEIAHADVKVLRIDENLGAINDRLADLQIESDDLKEFQQLEKSKKIYEFNLLDREVDDLTVTIEGLDLEYQELLAKSQHDLEELEKRERMCQSLSDTINELRVSQNIAAIEKEQSESDKTQLLVKLSEKKVAVEDLSKSLQAMYKTNEERQSTYKELQHRMKECEANLNLLKPDLEKLQEQEQKLKDKLAASTNIQRALYNKQSRFNQFDSKAARDDWLATKIAELKSSLSEKEKEVQSLQTEFDTHTRNLSQLTERQAELEKLLSTDNSGSISSLRTEVASLKEKIIDLADTRKQLWRDEIRLKSIKDSLTNDYMNASDSVNKTMDRSHAQGLLAVKNITQKLGLTDNVYGQLLDLFTVGDKYKIAAEVVAGNALFHVVVDNDTTASLLMEEMSRLKAGRATFVPLNRLRVPTYAYPDKDHQCIPLIKKLKFDEKVSKAMTQIFGSTIVVGDLQDGSALARAFKLNAITLDGDRASNQGVLSGGFRDYKSSRLDAIKSQLKKKKELDKVEGELSGCLKKIDETNHELNTIQNHLRQKVVDLENGVNSQEPYKAELSQIEGQKYDAEQHLESLKVRLFSLTAIVRDLESNISYHEDELNSDFSNTLSDAENAELADINEEINYQEEELNKVFFKLAKIETEVSTYETDLKNDILPRLSKLKLSGLLEPQTFIDDEGKLKEINSEYESLQVQFDTADSRNTTTVQEYEKITKEISASEKALEKANRQQSTLVRKIESFSKSSEKILSRKSMLGLRREEVQKKIRDLGVLPEEAFQKAVYEKSDSEELLKKLNDTNDELSKYAHINKKALEQYNTFTKRRDELVQRRKELEQSKDSIEELIQSLKRQKDSAIKKSFKQVSKSFHEIFEKLVPLGTGKLSMLRKSDTTTRDGNGDGNDVDLSIDLTQQLSQTQIANITENSNAIEDYVGVGISVSFNSKHDEQQRIEQLSGGQKSLCAIALILAIQKCDPAPFYLFDEIDANLDHVYRLTVAAMVHSLSSQAQFICTTFRPEMVEVADNFYGVMFANKVSTILEINQEQALGFVQGR